MNVCARDLTLAERAELEQFSDGPITPQMIADKIAQRGRQLSHGEIVFRIKQCALEIEWHEGLMKEETSAYMRRYDEACIKKLNDEIAKLDAQLSSMAVQEPVQEQFNIAAE